MACGAIKNLTTAGWSARNSFGRFDLGRSFEFSNLENCSGGVRHLDGIEFRVGLSSAEIADQFHGRKLDLEDIELNTVTHTVYEAQYSSFLSEITNTL